LPAAGSKKSIKKTRNTETQEKAEGAWLGKEDVSRQDAKTAKGH
jgi:hypothetical protein